MNQDFGNINEIKNVIETLYNELSIFTSNYYIRAEFISSLTIYMQEDNIKINSIFDNGLSISSQKGKPTITFAVNDFSKESLKAIVAEIRSLKDKSFRKNRSTICHKNLPSQAHYSSPYIIDFNAVSLEEKIEGLKNFNFPSIKGELSFQTIYTEKKLVKAIFQPDSKIITLENQTVGLTLSQDYLKNGIPQTSLFEKYTSGGWEVIKNLMNSDLDSMHKHVLGNMRLESKAKPVKTGKYTVLLSPQVSGSLAHELGHTSEADLAFSTPLKKEEELSPKVKEGILNVVDKGVHENCICFCPVDDEGILAKDTIIYKNSLRNAFLTNKEAADIYNLPKTGNARAQDYFSIPLVRMRNTFIQEGDSSYEEMIDGERNYIYAVKSAGGHFHLGKYITLRCSLGILFRSESPSQPISNFSIKVSIDQMPESIQLVGQDLEHFNSYCSKVQVVPISFGGPHIKMEAFILGS